MGLVPKVRDQRPVRGRDNRELKFGGLYWEATQTSPHLSLRVSIVLGFIGGNLQHRGNKGQGGFGLGAGVPGVGVLDAWNSGFEEATNT